MKRIKRFLAVFLAVMMVLSALPGNAGLSMDAHAEGTDDAVNCMIAYDGETYTFFENADSVLKSDPWKLIIDDEIIASELPYTSVIPDIGNATISLSKSLLDSANTISFENKWFSIPMVYESGTDGMDEWNNLVQSGDVFQKYSTLTIPKALDGSKIADDVSVNGKVTVNGSTYDLNVEGTTVAYYIPNDSEPTVTYSSVNYIISGDKDGYTVVPDVKSVEINGEDTIKAKDEASYVLKITNSAGTDVTKAWIGHVSIDYELSNGASASHSSEPGKNNFVLDTTNAGNVKLTAYFSLNHLSTGDSEVVATKDVTIEKINTTLLASVGNTEDWSKNATVTVTLKDEYGDAMYADEIVLTTNSEKATFTKSDAQTVTVETDINGVATATLKTTGKENFVISVAYAGTGAYKAQETSVSYDPKKVNITLDPIVDRMPTYGLGDFEKTLAIKDGELIVEDSVKFEYLSEAKDVVKATYTDYRKVTFEVLNAGTETVKVTYDTQNYSYTQFIEITVNPYPLQFSGEDAVVPIEKVYDGTSFVEKITANLVTTDTRYIGTTVVPTTIENENYDTTIVDVYKDNDGNAVANKYAANFDIATSTWNGEQKRNFTLVTNTAHGNITIQPATLTLTVNNAQRSFRDLDYNPADLQTLLDIKGFIGTESPATLAGFVAPQVVDSTAVDNIKENDATHIGVNVDVLELDTTYANASHNYEFDFANYVKGDLTINAEKVNGDEYVVVNNTASKNVYQESEDAPKYFGNGANVVFTLAGGYNKVLFGGADATTAGSAVERSVDTETTVTNSYVLQKVDTLGNVIMETEPFNVTFTYDGDVPTGEIVFGQKYDTVSALEKALTFGTFGKDTLKADVTVKDVSGLAKVAYYIQAVDKDGNYADFAPSEETLWKPATYTAAKDADGYTAEFEVLVGELEADNTVKDNNYVVFILVEDAVGNNTVYGSNGIIIEDYHYVGTTITPSTEAASGKDKLNIVHYSGEVGVMVNSEEEGTVYSGLHSVEYLVDFEDDSLNQTAVIYQDDLGKEDTPNDTLADIKAKYGKLGTKDAVVLGKELAKSQEVLITAKTTDFAGNVYDDAELTLVLDPVAPVITESWSEAYQTKEDIAYYGIGAKAVYTAAITERYLDYDNVKVTVEKDGVETILTLTELLVADTWAALGIENVSASTSGSEDATVTDITITFATEGDYVVSVSATDYATNACAGTPKAFIIDYTVPVLDVVYTANMKDSTSATFVPGTDEASRYYANENVEYIGVKATITEKNFGLADEELDAALTVTAVDSANADVTVADYDADAKTYAEWKTTEANVYVNNFDVTVDANYTAVFEYTDLAGNEIAAYAADYFTLDRVRPQGTIIVDGLVNGTGDDGSSKKTWIDKFISGITFGLFGKDDLNASLESSDVTAGVASTQYLATSTLYTREGLAALADSNWKDYTSAVALNANKNVIVYEKVTDKAGNTEYFSSENLVADNVDPAPVVTITPSEPAWGKGVYAATDNPGFDISVTDPINNDSYSGLKEISYKIVNGTTGETETGVLVTYGNTEHVQKWTGHVNIDPDKFYSNDVQVTVTASDWSTNEATSETISIKVDPVAPVVTFAFDTSDVLNGKYYNNDKTLTITVEERNFDTSYIPTVTSTTGTGYNFGGWTSNGETHTGIVTFTGDSDYTVTFDCYDLAGNKSNTEELAEFTVDKTLPVIAVSYDNNNVENGKYYKAERTATITITEHNFNASDVKIVTTAALDGETLSAPTIGGWSNSGDKHTAVISYPGDADYTFDIDCTDLAGNASADYAQDVFTVDKTKPTVTIEGVENKSANKGTVAPVINLSDVNFNNDDVTITLVGANNGNVAVDGLATTTAVDNGIAVTFKNFTNDMDDIYTLTAKTKDFAGNETTQSITFSVNRNGSTYVIDEATQGLIDNGYTNAPQDIVIQEINVDTLEFIEITYDKDGEVVVLTEGTDYTVEVEGNDGEWKKYTYTIFANVFDEEGQYSINIYSEDRAANTTTNKVKEKSIDFIVDKTAPVVSIANLEDRGRYKEEAHEFTLTVKDNAAVAYVELYLDGELVKTYEGEEISVVNGVITIIVDQKGDYQNVKLIAYDAAGNPTDPVEYNVLVTANAWLQFVNNTPLFVGSIALIVIIIGIIIFLIAKRKKNEEK